MIPSPSPRGELLPRIGGSPFFRSDTFSCRNRRADRDGPCPTRVTRWTPPGNLCTTERVGLGYGSFLDRAWPGGRRTVAPATRAGMWQGLRSRPSRWRHRKTTLCRSSSLSASQLRRRGIRREGPDRTTLTSHTRGTGYAGPRRRRTAFPRGLPFPRVRAVRRRTQWPADNPAGGREKELSRGWKSRSTADERPGPRGPCRGGRRRDHRARPHGVPPRQATRLAGGERDWASRLTFTWIFKYSESLVES